MTSAPRCGTPRLRSTGSPGPAPGHKAQAAPAATVSKIRGRQTVLAATRTSRRSDYGVTGDRQGRHALGMRSSRSVSIAWCSLSANSRSASPFAAVANAVSLASAFRAAAQALRSAAACACDPHPSPRCPPLPELPVFPPCRAACLLQAAVATPAGPAFEAQPGLGSMACRGDSAVLAGRTWCAAGDLPDRSAGLGQPGRIRALRS